MHLVFVTLHNNGQKSAEYQILATVAICIQFFQQIFKRNIVQRHSNNSVSEQLSASNLLHFSKEKSEQSVHIYIYDV